jgi:hypothetical protein
MARESLNRYLISPGSLRVRDDNGRLELGTNIDVLDQVTIYKQIDSGFTFTPATGGTPVDRELDQQDILIERYQPSMVTWIHNGN